MDRWIREEIHIRKEQDKSMNRDEGSINNDIWWTLVPKRQQRLSKCQEW